MNVSRLVAVGFVGMVVLAMLLGYVAAQEGSAVREEGAKAARPAAEAPPAHDVVIVWSGGSSAAPPLPLPEAGAVDAVTQSTPEAWNVKEIAERLAKELEAAGHSVLVISAEECRDPRHVTQAKALVLGCPEYFGLPPWQMVRFFDETLYRIWRAKIRLSNHVVSAFCTNQRCLGVLEDVLRSTQGKAAKGAVISARGTSEAEREASVKQLGERIAAALSEGN